MELIQTHLSKKLVELRGTRSLYEISHKAGIPLGRLHDFEKGESIPDEGCMLKLAYGLGVEVFDLKRAHYDDIYSSESFERDYLFRWVQEHLACGEA